ncbi:unnamed protein product [Paramecium primaurelia]|uniref:Uncharacterized protein n=1 Tax=Paramecium primaurelia TaxID=5886 RepID=A0A8S1ND18_PARPR|nr:unnamed protein product [Paramecium primaurelia]
MMSNKLLKSEFLKSQIKYIPSLIIQLQLTQKLFHKLFNCQINLLLLHLEDLSDQLIYFTFQIIDALEQDVFIRSVPQQQSSIYQFAIPQSMENQTTLIIKHTQHEFQIEIYSKQSNHWSLSTLNQ